MTKSCITKLKVGQVLRAFDIVPALCFVFFVRWLCAGYAKQIFKQMTTLRCLRISLTSGPVLPVDAFMLADQDFLGSKTLISLETQ